MTDRPRVGPRVELALLAVLLALYLALLGRTLDHELVWDDVLEIQHSSAFDRPLLDGLRLTQTERTAPDLTELTTIELAYDSYRPLLFASLWLDVQLWGRSPRALHATNVLLGALAILAAYALARRWLRGPLALVPTALFALHPLQIEAVAYVSGRGDVLAGLFALLSASAALRAGDAGGRRAACWLALACVAFAASLLSKEAYVGLPLAIALVAWAERRLRAGWWIPVALCGVAGAYLALRAALVTSTTGGAFADALLAMPGILVQYLQLVLLPFDLSTERLRAPELVPAGLVLGAIAAGGVIAFRLRRGELPARARAALAALGWYVVLLAPAAVPIASMGVVADRYVYAPIFGLGVAAVTVLSGLVALRPRLRRPLWIAGGLWATLCIIVAWAQVPVWRDNTSLYTHAATMTPESSKAQYRLGYLDAQTGRWPEAITRFEAAVALDPSNVLALNNLGVAYLRTGQLPQAEHALARAVDLNPAHFRAWLNLGLARIEQGERARGCADLARALEINPRYAAAHRELERRCQ